MHLFYTDESFRPQGISRPGIPFLCDEQMRLVAAPNGYLRYIATISGRTQSRRTWETYGNHLYEFFSFLESNQLPWTQATLNDLANWRDSMRGRNCSRSTVNQRLRCAQHFYVWAQSAGLINEIPASYESVRVTKARSFLSHLDQSSNRTNASVLTLPTHDAVPNFLRLDDALNFIDALSSDTLKLMAFLGLLSGLRRDEITALSATVLPNPCGTDHSKPISMLLDAAKTPTKGSKTRMVVLPFDLAAALWQYFCEIWPIREQKYRSTHGRSTTRLFLSPEGREYSSRYLNYAFNLASRKCGIKCNPHTLRHTFGTYELLRVGKRYTQSQALLWVRDRMGHSSISTTETYLHTSLLIKNDSLDQYHADVLSLISR